MLIISDYIQIHFLSAHLEQGNALTSWVDASTVYDSELGGRTNNLLANDGTCSAICQRIIPMYKYIIDIIFILKGELRVALKNPVANPALQFKDILLPPAPTCPTINTAPCPFLAGAYHFKLFYFICESVLISRY